MQFYLSEILQPMLRYVSTNVLFDRNAIIQKNKHALEFMNQIEQFIQMQLPKSSKVALLVRTSNKTATSLDIAFIHATKFSCWTNAAELSQINNNKKAWLRKKRIQNYPEKRDKLPISFTATKIVCSKQSAIASIDTLSS